MMSSHKPVMLQEVIAHLEPHDKGIYVDGTFGRGGYTRALLERGCHVIALDQDEEAIVSSTNLVASYSTQLKVIKERFSRVQQVLADFNITAVDGFVLDLGVSSPQIDEAKRGFSFRFDGPLDMRMDLDGFLTAASVVNHYDEKTLADIFYTLGEERYSRRVARAIIQQRAIAPLETTSQLATLIRSVVRKSQDKLDPATRCFQALRLHVNNELGELEQALEASLCILKPGGRMVVVTFHSLEDRCVKKFFRHHSTRAPQPSRYSLPRLNQESKSVFRLLTSKAIGPSVQECRENPRSSSAKLRAVERLQEGA